MGAEEPVRRRRKDSGARREKRAESLSSASGPASGKKVVRKGSLAEMIEVFSIRKDERHC